jgi:hypothetical protein
MMYSRIVNPPKKADRIHRIRTTVGSRSRYSAVPEATPARSRSCRQR